MEREGKWQCHTCQSLPLTWVFPMGSHNPSILQARDGASKPPTSLPWAHLRGHRLPQWGLPCMWMLPEARWTIHPWHRLYTSLAEMPSRIRHWARHGGRSHLGRSRSRDKWLSSFYSFIQPRLTDHGMVPPALGWVFTRLNLSGDTLTCPEVCLLADSYENEEHTWVKERTLQQTVEETGYA